MNTSAFGTGLMMGLSLIVVIGAQNVFVLRQGLYGRDVFWVCLTCAVSDALLITLGVTGFRVVSEWLPWVEPAMRYGGAAFLIWYGARSLMSALRSGGALTAVPGDLPSTRRTLLSCLALTWLNPHVYLDTVVLLGSVSMQFGQAQVSFAAGAIIASFLFFFSLGYGATLLKSWFGRPGTWRVLDVLVAAVMWLIAAKLLSGA